MKGLYVGSKERGRRLANQRIDRSHRKEVGVRQRHHPPWTRGEKAVLVLILALIVAAVILTILLFLL